MTHSESASPLTLTLFGPMQVFVRGQGLPHLRSRKALWLLALLVLRAGRPVEREWLAGMLWPDADQDQAQANLRTALSEMRQALGSEGERLKSPSRRLLQLDLSGADADVTIFDQAISSGQPASLARAAALYRGPLLEGCSEEWVGQERAAREQDCLRALLALANTARAAGDFETAAEYSRRAVALDPWRDAARRSLMETLARSGDVNAALQVYREFAALLQDDPKAAPDAQTSALYARLRAEARRQAAVPTAAVAAPPPAVTGYLPHPLTDLVGREDERIEVTARLRRSRLVTLTGPGGIGKTRLALEIAAEAVAGYADGAWLVALESLSDGAQVAGQIGEVLGLKEETGRTRVQSLTDHLRAKNLLLVLDNCEHLREASARIAAHLLGECAGVRVLATSREPLGITGEAVWAVPSLAVPDPAHLPPGQATLRRVLMGYEGVQLFVERAQLVQKAFSLTGTNALPTAQICFRLEGIPLAIELAAARAKVMTAEQIAARLSDHLALLTGGDRTRLPRQQTLRATLDWSYELLTEPERMLLGRLSVFAGGWNLAAAERICAGDGLETGQVLDLLSSLTDQSLIAFEERLEGERENGGRYRLLEIVRQYAAERLAASGEAEHLGTRHRDYFLALAEQAEPLLTGADQKRQMTRLKAEHGNLRAALAWCRADQAGGETGVRLAGSLWQFWELYGYYSEGRAFLSEALEKHGADRRSDARAKALNAVGVLASYQGDHAAARARHEESLAISRERADKPGIAWALNDLGKLASHQGDYTAAQAAFEESLVIFRELGQKRGIAGSLHHLGDLAAARGDCKTAWALYDESLALFREMGNKQGIAWTLNDMGSLTREHSDDSGHAAARTLHEESLMIFRELEHKRGIGWSLHQLGKLAREQGDSEAAWTLYEESLAISRELADKPGIAWALNDLGNVASGQSDYRAARARHEESLAISRELADNSGIAWALHHLANVAAAQEDYETAWALYDESLALFREVGNKQGIAWTLYYRGVAALDQGNFSAAQTQHAESIAVLKELGDRKGVAAGLRGLAAALAPQASGKAAHLWGAADALCEGMGVRLFRAELKRYERQAAQIRASLSEDAFAAAWQKGRALTWEQAVAYALKAVVEDSGFS